MPPVTPAGALIGRDSEIALLAGLVKEVAKGNGGCLLIEGEPGIGKTSLVRAAAAEAIAAGCEVFWGTGDELGQELPLLPFLDALQVREASVNPRRTAIAQMLRGEGTIDRGADVPAMLAEQLLALVGEQAVARPTILVIDDLQWADSASIGLWARLARTASRMPLLLIGISRLAPYRDDLLAMRRAVDEAGRLQLSGLSDAAVTILVEALSGTTPAQELLRLAEGAAGNPFYITELVAAFTRGSIVPGTVPGGTGHPDSLSAAITDRLGFAAGTVREVLQAAALLGMDFSVTDLATVLGKSVADLVPAINQAKSAGVLTEVGQGLGFRHPLIRSALYDDMPSGLRAAWHREAGRALADAVASPDRVARQMLRALGGSEVDGRPLDDWMVSWLLRNADTLVGQAPGVAVELLIEAVDGFVPGQDRYGWFASKLADALYRTGDRERAEQVAERALTEVDDPDVIVDLHWTLAQCRMLEGRSAESLAALDTALSAPDLSVRYRARLLVLAARTHSHLGDVESAGKFAERALSVASEARDAWSMGWALHVLTLVRATEGQFADALPLFDSALDVTRSDSALTDLRLMLQVNKALTLGCVDQYAEAFAVVKQAARLASQVGTTMRMTQAHCALGQLLYETGQWREALAEVEALPEDRKEPGVACCDLGIVAVLRFHWGGVEEARRNLAAAAPHVERIGRRPIAPLALARSLDREFEGETVEALAELTGAFDASEGDIGGLEDLLADAVRLAIATGDLETAGTLAGHAQTLAHGTEIPHRQANALHCQGLLDHDPGLLLAAAERYYEATRPLLRAQALEAAAKELLRTDTAQARAAFNDAVDVYESLGATADVNRLTATFRQEGIRRGPHSKHRRAQAGWDSLTPTEAKIADYVAEGLSNPEIAAKLLLSRRTVATHVSHVLKKLNVHSRTDIAREAALRTRGR